MAMLCLVLATVTTWGVDLRHTVFRLDHNNIFRISGTAFFALCTFIFLCLLVRRIISGSLAIYSENDQLIWIQAIGVNKISLADIATVEKWLNPGMISIRTKSGAQRYIGTGVTDTSADRTVSMILALLERFR
jgi:hypothetical protein